MPTDTTWPKQIPELSAEQRRIRDDFMRYWHEVLPSRYSLIERFNHNYPARNARAGAKTLEIGAGIGEHLAFEPYQDDNYWAIELREEMAAEIARRYPQVHTLVADCQQRIPLEDDSFDRVLAIHVLEHLPNLPAAISELHRVLKPDGSFIAVIPCEGGLAYWMARRISAQRIFERRYGTSYKWCIRSEHINVPSEIRSELGRCFEIIHHQYFPLRIPLTTINLVIGLEMRPLAPTHVDR